MLQRFIRPPTELRSAAGVQPSCSRLTASAKSRPGSLHLLKRNTPPLISSAAIHFAVPAGLRIFADADGKMNRGVTEIGGGVLVVSQFTLYGDCRKGRRPSFVGAAAPEIAEPLYKAFLDGVRALGVPVAAGRFGALMQVELVNDGPVTLIIDAP
jgi:D-Tyr-tRNAtyr deacylase